LDAARNEAKDESTTLEISVDTKSKVSLDETVLGGKNQNGQPDNQRASFGGLRGLQLSFCSWRSYGGPITCCRRFELKTVQRTDKEVVSERHRL